MVLVLTISANRRLARDRDLDLISSIDRVLVLPDVPATPRGTCGHHLGKTGVAAAINAEKVAQGHIKSE